MHICACARVHAAFYVSCDCFFSRAKPEDDNSEEESCKGEPGLDLIAALRNIFLGKCYLDRSPL